MASAEQAQTIGIVGQEASINWDSVYRTNTQIVLSSFVALHNALAAYPESPAYIPEVEGVKQTISDLAGLQALHEFLVDSYLDQHARTDIIGPITGTRMPLGYAEPIKQEQALAFARDWFERNGINVESHLASAHTAVKSLFDRFPAFSKQDQTHQAAIIQGATDALLLTSLTGIDTLNPATATSSKPKVIDNALLQRIVSGELSLTEGLQALSDAAQARIDTFNPEEVASFLADPERIASILESHRNVGETTLHSAVIADVISRFSIYLTSIAAGRKPAGGSTGSNSSTPGQSSEPGHHHWGYYLLAGFTALSVLAGGGLLITHLPAANATGGGPDRNPHPLLTPPGATPPHIDATAVSLPTAVLNVTPPPVHVSPVVPSDPTEEWQPTPRPSATVRVEPSNTPTPEMQNAGPLLCDMPAYCYDNLAKLNSDPEVQEKFLRAIFTNLAAGPNDNKTLFQGARLNTFDDLVANNMDLPIGVELPGKGNFPTSMVAWRVLTTPLSLDTVFFRFVPLEKNPDYQHLGDWDKIIPHSSSMVSLGTNGEVRFGIDNVLGADGKSRLVFIVASSIDDKVALPTLSEMQANPQLGVARLNRAISAQLTMLAKMQNMSHWRNPSEGKYSPQQTWRAFVLNDNNDAILIQVFNPNPNSLR